MSIRSSALHIALRGLERTRRPRLTGRLKVRGVAAPVEILRDAWGVPHIYAQSVHDLLFAQGFVHAQDRLWQMDFQRRLVAGRLAEVIGPEVVSLDRNMRILGMRRVSEREVALLSAAVHAELAAYAAGINACITSQPLPIEFTLLRYRPERWTIADSLSWDKMMAWSLSINWETELLRGRLIEALGAERAAELEPPWPTEWPLVVPSAPAQVVDVRAAASPPLHLGAPGWGNSDGRGTLHGTAGAGGAGAGSNNWVVAGRRTANGMPLLANDMHLLLSAPAIWYENHLVCEAIPGGNRPSETLNVTGITFPGIPYIVAGHNGHVAWGFTNGFPDVQDLYIERMRPAKDADGREGGAEYEYDGEWHPAEVRHEVIHVKGRQPVVQTVVSTRHGPIINELAQGLATQPRAGAPGEIALPDVPLALRWTALEPDTMVDALHSMIRAQTCLEFREALRGWETPVQNTVYADTQGNIGYSYPGRIPVRKRGDGSLPVPGWTNEYEWQGYIPFDELPHQYNPPQGFVVSANNRVVGADYPYFIGREFEVGDRAQRIVELLAAQRKADAAAFRRMQFDHISPSMQIIAQHLSALQPGEGDLAPIVALVRRWDGQLSADSPAAAICEVFLHEFARVVLTAHLPPVPDGEKDGTPSLVDRLMGRGPTPFIQEASFFAEQTCQWALDLLAARESHWYDLGGGETRDDVLRLALRRTTAYLTERLGPPEGPQLSNWAWGQLHTLTFGHMAGSLPVLGPHFNRGPYPVPGDGNTIWATGTGITPESSRSAVGPPFRFIADLGDLRNSLGLLAPGNSGRPDSPHYDDQVEAWFKGEYHPMLYAREDVVAGAKAELWLVG